MNSFPLRKFTAVSFHKISLNVLVYKRLPPGSWLFVVSCDAWLFLSLASPPQTRQWSVNSCKIDQSVTPFLDWRRVCLLQKSPQSVFSPLVPIPYCNITSWFGIALAEIRTRRILREKADCKQSSQTWRQSEVMQFFTNYFPCIRVGPSPEAPKISYNLVIRDKNNASTSPCSSIWCYSVLSGASYRGSRSL